MTTPDPVLIVGVALLGQMGVWRAHTISRMVTLLSLSTALSLVGLGFVWTD